MNALSRKVLTVTCGLVALVCFCKALPGLFQETPSTSATVHAAVSSRDSGVPTKRLTTSPIQDLRVGMRLVGRNPDRDDAVELPDPDPQTWRKLELRMEHKPGRFVDVVLIRPLEWIEEEAATVGEVIWLELPEMHAAGDAEVLAISACPALEPGSGSVITGTFRHEADELVELRLSGQPDPLRCTTEHPFWSATRHEFVAANALRPGEEIETATGSPALLTSITPRAGPETVYGLEVFGEHVYHVSQAGLLVHNASTAKASAFRSLNDEDIASLQNGQGIRRTGTGSLADTILESKRTRFIPATEDFKVVQKYGDTNNYIRFRTDKLPVGQYISKDQILSSKMLRKELGAKGLGYVRGQSHSAVVGEIPFDAIEEIVINGQRLKK